MTLKMYRNIVLAVMLMALAHFMTAGRALCSDEAVKEPPVVDLQKKNAELEKALAEAKNYNAQLEAKAKELHLKCTDLEQQLKNSSGMGKAVDSLRRERQILKDANQQYKDSLNKERADNEAEKAELYQQLGTAYTKAELFSLAIDAYNKALAINGRNAEVHYNLGLLYRHSKNNSKKAIQHLKKYLQLNPDASNRKDVEYIIKMLSE
jgi:tetratricopeptide (TPR) repeat protein